MFARFLEIATEGLVGVLGKYGFLADVGQSLEMTRVALYTIPLVLPLHFIIITHLTISKQLFSNIQGETVEATKPDENK